MILRAIAGRLLWIALWPGRATAHLARQMVRDGLAATSLNAAGYAVPYKSAINVENLLPVLHLTKFANVRNNEPLSRPLVDEISIFGEEDLSGGRLCPTAAAFGVLAIPKRDLFRRALEIMQSLDWQPCLVVTERTAMRT